MFANAIQPQISNAAPATTPLTLLHLPSAFSLRHPNLLPVHVPPYPPPWPNIQLVKQPRLFPGEALVHLAKVRISRGLLVVVRQQALGPLVRRGCTDGRLVYDGAVPSVQVAEGARDPEVAVFGQDRCNVLHCGENVHVGEGEARAAKVGSVKECAEVAVDDPEELSSSDN
jgi:hypothetical protein